MPNPRHREEDEEDDAAGLKETIVDYDQFFNGKRDPKEMKRALRESQHNLNRFRRSSHGGGVIPLNNGSDHSLGTPSGTRDLLFSENRRSKSILQSQLSKEDDVILEQICNNLIHKKPIAHLMAQTSTSKNSGFHS